MVTSNEKRTNEAPDTNNLSETLNEEQKLTLKKLEEFGWVLKFVRRPLFQDVVVVLFHPDGSKLAILDIDGNLDMHPEASFRE